MSNDLIRVICITKWIKHLHRMLKVNLTNRWQTLIAEYIVFSSIELIQVEQL